MSATKVHEYKVEMTCDGCAGAVQRVLGKLQDKVEKVDVNVPDKSVKVTTSCSAEEILEVIKKTGKTTEYVSSS